MSKNKKCKNLLFVSSVLFILLFSTKIVLLIPENGYEITRKVSLQTLSNIKPDFIYRVEDINLRDDLRSTVEIIGFAYFEDRGVSADKKRISIILSSEKFTYVIETKLTDRLDLRADLAEANAKGLTHGFHTIFSPLGLANGTYELYIYCYEDEANAGYIKTDKVFIKQYSEFVELDTISPEEVN